MLRKTKIICTLGPATEDESVLRRLMLGGMNAARFNFSHCTHEDAAKKLEAVTRLREELGLPIATILDTKGPEIRVKTFQNGPVQLRAGDTFTLTTREVEGDEKMVSITYQDLTKDLKAGARVLIDDGLVELRAEEVTDTDIVCTVINGGQVSNHKGINVPGTQLSMPFISEQDRADIIFGIEHGFDYIAASFTRSAKDILAIRNILKEYDCHSINIIAKIENMEGVDNIDEILRVVEGIMVARGDMGVEIPLEDVPVLQKQLIQKSYLAGKQVVTATQMLDSMIKNPRPTRAESTDVANAIYDGTSCIMLSGETAAGKYPVEALETMVRIAEKAEESINYIKRFNSRDNSDVAFDVTNAISHATCTTAHDLGAKAIVTVTKGGGTARQLSKFRPMYPHCGMHHPGARVAPAEPLLGRGAHAHRRGEGYGRALRSGSGRRRAHRPGPQRRSGGDHRRRAPGHFRHHQHDESPRGGPCAAHRGWGHPAERFRPAVRVQAAFRYPQALPGWGHPGGA